LEMESPPLQRPFFAFVLIPRLLEWQAGVRPCCFRSSYNAHGIHMLWEWPLAPKP
jgi:hypothetical protein